MPTPSPRPRLAGLALVVALAAGCGTGQTPAAPTAPSAAAMAGGATDGGAATALTLASATTGSVQLRVSGLGGYRLQATTSQVATLRVTLSGGPLTTPVTRDVTAASLAGGNGTVTFDGIPPGTVSVKVEALDAAGASLGVTTGSTAVTNGQTAVVTVALQLNATHVTNPNGGVAVSLTVTDGAVIVDPVASAASTSPQLSPVPSPTATPTPVVEILGTPETAWFPDGSMGVKGHVTNTFPTSKNVRVTAVFSKRTLVGHVVVTSVAQDIGPMAAGAQADFDIASGTPISNWLGEGSVVVTVSTY